jgi:hypothetical protein
VSGVLSAAASSANDVRLSAHDVIVDPYPTYALLREARRPDFPPVARRGGGYQLGADNLQFHGLATLPATTGNG